MSPIIDTAAASLVLAQAVPASIAWLATVNAALNGLATVLLIAALALIKRGRVIAHRNVMLAAFATSVLFLITYLTYHYLLGGGVKYRGEGTFRYVYFFILATHVTLAAAVPFLAIGAIYYGLKDRREAHRKIVKWAYPIWLYVSITGVVIYFILYHFNPTV